MDDIYLDLKNLVEKTHTAIVLEKNKKILNNEKTKQIQQNIKIQQEIKKEIKTQSCQTTTTKQTEPERHIYVSLPPAGRRGTKTDMSILNWSQSLRFPYM
tara:strand:+ start:181 stop:480 length:300 start_codon:yes stop_codon:yes gene_type:complete